MTDALRSSIRDFLLVTVIAALTLAWWIDRSRLHTRAKTADTWKFRAESLAERLQPNGWQVKWDKDEIFITQKRADGKLHTVSRNMNAKPLSQAEIQAALAAHATAQAASGAPIPVAVRPQSPTSSR